MANTYAVEIHYDYEGSSLRHVGTSRLDAFACANGIANGDRIEISRWLEGKCVETWNRQRGEQDYSRRIIVKGKWEDVKP